ncbi:MAG: hypothetical protein ONB44_18455 [candidate division KSB1 bacterium]|nr:hypothetical protein [candidate division KSB1 bacterium]MDZ7304112.1 hypothetical protein [candidate division KSB1 bacterium]MDZ7313391.1 hypothetical protein [candidate division KSB1 bacterium]
MARFGKTIVEFLTLTEEQRKIVGEKVLELGNIGAGALIFGSALAEGRIKWFHLVSGVLFLDSLILYLSSSYQITR